ncbi:MAG: hypothetical protein QOH50_3980 [Kribbellaceae bacterium]|nr:hypothetical protein [Kribbellaceae bacterium]
MDPVITEQLGPRHPTPAAANRFPATVTVRVMTDWVSTICSSGSCSRQPPSEPATARMAALSRFHVLIDAIAITRAASCCSS